MVRVSVVGSSGAGKTTFGRELADRLGIPFVELDAIFHQPGWTELPGDEFRQRVAEAVAGALWVCDGNYAAVRPIVLARATDVVWLDLPRRVVMTRVVRRSAARAVTRRELWNGNRERASTWLRPDHPIRWAWSQHHRKQVEYAERFASAELGHLRVHRVRSRGEVGRLLGGLAPR